MEEELGLLSGKEMNEARQRENFVMAPGQMVKEQVKPIETVFNKKRPKKKAEETDLLKNRRGRDRM